MDALLTELRYALRSLMRAPGLSLIVVLLLSIGIGLNATFFSLLYGIILKPLDYPKSEELAMIFLADDQGGDKWFLSAGAFRDIKNEVKAFGDVTAFTGAGFALETESSAEAIYGLNVAENFFGVLGQREPAIGRLPQSGESESILITHNFWTRYFGASRNVVGQSVMLSGKNYHVAGVLSEHGSCRPVVIPRLSGFWIRVQQRPSGTVEEIGAYWHASSQAGISRRPEPS